jgi:hypothetical protein
MTLKLLHSEFPYTVYEENFIKFFISVLLNNSCISSALSLFLEKKSILQTCAGIFQHSGRLGTE